jgi:hypothetical protein
VVNYLQTRVFGFIEVLYYNSKVSLFQKPVSFGQAPGKTGQKPGFSAESKEAVPKAEVLEQPQVKKSLGETYGKRLECELAH